jgi:hypothetical protein
MSGVPWLLLALAACLCGCAPAPTVRAPAEVVYYLVCWRSAQSTQTGPEACGDRAAALADEQKCRGQLGIPADVTLGVVPTNMRQCMAQKGWEPEIGQFDAPPESRRTTRCEDYFPTTGCPNGRQ